MKKSLALLFLFALFIQRARAMEHNPIPCALCNEVHTVNISQKNDSSGLISEPQNFVLINLEMNIWDFLLQCFPCLAVPIKDLRDAHYLFPRTPEENNLQRHPHYRYAISKEHVLALGFLASIAKDNDKLPFAYQDAEFFQEKIEWQAYTKKWLEWRPLLLFLIFSAGGAASNFFTFINIYESGLDSNNNSVINTWASLAVQDSLLALGTGIFGFLSSAFSLVWTGLNQDALRDMATRLHKITHLINHEYWELAQTLIILNFYYPSAAKKMAKDINPHVIAERIRICIGDALSAEIIGAHNLFSVCEYILSNGQRLPKNYELQKLIFTLENNFRF